jgi:hypothetical protein
VDLRNPEWQRRKSARYLADVEPLIAREEAARRVRAAIGYAGFKERDVTERTSITPATLRRIVSLTDPRGATIEQLWEIAEACSVPRDFMEHGFSQPDGERSIEERIATLEEIIKAEVIPYAGEREAEEMERAMESRTADPAAAPAPTRSGSSGRQRTRRRQAR